MTAPIETTLLDLVRTLNSLADTEAEVIATAVYLVNTGKVVLCGSFRDQRIPLH